MRLLLCLLNCMYLAAFDILILLGVDFKIKYVTVGGKKLKLAIWDTGIFFSRTPALICDFRLLVVFLDV